MFVTFTLGSVHMFDIALSKARQISTNYRIENVWLMMISTLHNWIYMSKIYFGKCGQIHKVELFTGQHSCDYGTSLANVIGVQSHFRQRIQ